MRTIYFGTSDFAAIVLRALAASEHRPSLVVTRPARPRGRGRAVNPTPVAQAAQALSIETLAPPTLDATATERILAQGADVVCVCAYGALIREPLLSAQPLLNVHPSLLPRWRGAAPIERAIIAGDGETGICIMRATAELDAGPVALVAREPIAEDDTYGTLAPRLAAAGSALLIEALDTDPPFVEQDDALATYAEKITADDRWLDPTHPADELERRVRALEPHIGARLRVGDGALGVHAVRVLDRSPPASPAPPVGELVVDDGRLLLGCVEGALELLEVQPPGGRAMDASAYLRGRR